MPTKTREHDPAYLLRTPEAQAEFLSLALADGDPAEISHALGIIARARGMTSIARETGLARENLYKTLSVDGNPELSTLTRIMAALGMRLQAVAVSDDDALEDMEGPSPTRA